MPAFHDITGERYGKLTVVERVFIPGRTRGWWKCVCDCGNETIASQDSLKRNGKRSCGCLAIENHSVRHGDGGRKTRARLYRTWSGMIQRTTNPKDKAYPNYGGRGITICDEWRKDYSAFRAWAMNHGYTDSLYIDRIDNNRGYEPSNCRFVSRSKQQNNLRCNLRYLFSDGTIMTNTEAARALGISKNKVNRVIKDHILQTEEIDEKSHNPHLYILDCNIAFLCEMEDGS